MTRLSASNELQNNYSGLVGIVETQDGPCAVLTPHICCLSHGQLCPLYTLVFLCVCVHNACMIVRFLYLTTFPEAPLEFCFLYQRNYFFNSSVLYCVSARQKSVVDISKEIKTHQGEHFSSSMSNSATVPIVDNKLWIANT